MLLRLMQQYLLATIFGEFLMISYSNYDIMQRKIHQRKLDDIRDWRSTASNILVTIDSRLPDVVRPLNSILFCRSMFISLRRQIRVMDHKTLFQSSQMKFVSQSLQLSTFVDVGFGMHDLSMSHINKQCFDDDLQLMDKTFDQLAEGRFLQ